MFFITIILLSGSAKADTDCTIITKLELHQFMSPAITTNNTYGYNLFEYRLYSDEDNTTYRIIIDDITVGNGTIKHFKLYVNWICEQEIIYNLTVEIGDDVYSYYNIYIFSSSLYNYTVQDEKEWDIKFTDEEFELYLSRLRLKLFLTDIIGLIAGILVSTYSIREFKKTVIVEI